MLLGSEIILWALAVVALFLIVAAINNISLTEETGIVHIIPPKFFKVVYSVMWVLFIIALILIALA